MVQQHDDSIPMKNEMFAIGFVTDKARKGLITTAFGVLVFLLISSVGVIIWLIRAKDEMSAKYNSVFIKMMEQSMRTERKVDTTFLPKPVPLNPTTP